MSHKWFIIILLGLGLLTRFLFFGHPNETVFDEVHFGKFISGYSTREYFFDIHPPLGKLAIAGFAKLFNFKPGFAFQDIGNQFPDNQHLILRFLPSLAGALLPLVIYLLILEMGLAPIYAFLGGMLIVFENAILTQSHYILLDSFLLLFGFLSLLFYFKSKNYPLLAIRYWLLFGFFSGLAISVKWTGLGFLGLPLLVEFINIIKTREFKKIIPALMLPFFIAVLIYSLIFISHLLILNKSGPGDNYMSQGFQKSLIGNKVSIGELNDAIPKSNLFQKFIELNTEMYKANQRLTASHPYSSQWYTWPLMTRPIFYWVKDNSRIYLSGNPIIWWLSTTAVLMSLWAMAYGLWLKKVKLHGLTAVTSRDTGFRGAESSPQKALWLSGAVVKSSILPLSINYKLLVFLLSGYIINMLPFIGVKRVMFLYHYFTAYIFAILMLIWLISQTKNPKKLIGILLTLSIASFIFFAPLSYGLPLLPKAYELRVWFASWR